MNDFAKARALALIVPAALIAGALGSQYLGGLVPCEMCMWQRWPHYAAFAFVVVAFIVPKRGVVALAALAIFVSGAIGLWHAGVEYHWWQGLTHCSKLPSAGSGSDFIADIMKTPLVRCDEAQWTLFGVSLAGYNALISGVAALQITRLLTRRAQ